MALVAKARGGYPQIVTIEKSRPAPDSPENIGYLRVGSRRAVDSVSRALQFVHPCGKMEWAA
jgi:hypothetical protein